jgi:hypothetical protein
VELRRGNLDDDPETKSVIAKRGINYLERIRISSKVCTFLMMCANVEGKLASTYVIYKAEQLWLTHRRGSGLQDRIAQSLLLLIAVL